GQISVKLQNLFRFLRHVLGHKDRGILGLDADALTNVLFYEIIDNVYLHAQRTHCLVAAWCRPDSLRVSADEYHKEEAGFFEQWIAENRLAFLDIAIADSGSGILSALGKAFDDHAPHHEGVPAQVRSRDESILFWALSRWSTSLLGVGGSRRGTR